MLDTDNNFTLKPVPEGRTKGMRSAIVQYTQAKDLNLIMRTLRLLKGSVDDLRSKAQEDRLAKLVEALIVGEPRSTLDTEIEADNAALRAQYLATAPSYSAADLHALAGSRAANKSALAGSWKDSGRVFAVQFQGTDRFAAFQFADGQPRPVIKEILTALPAQMTAWQIAFWFASGNGWLNGRAPQDCLDDAAVVAAAAQMGTPALG
jgi:hypothetical protein